MACAKLGDTEVEDDLKNAERSRPTTPMQRTELLLENMLSKMKDLARSQTDLRTDLVKSQNDMENRLSLQQTVLAKETASELQSLARDTATSLERLEEGQGQLAFTQARQTAEVSEIVHRLNNLEMSGSNSRMSNRSISPTTNPYLEGSTLKVPAYSAGALVPPATLVNPSFNVISTVGTSTFSTPLEEGSGQVPVTLRRSLRIQERNRSDYRTTDKSDFRSTRQTRMKEVFDSQDRSGSNALSSPVRDIVLESRSLAPRTLDYSQSEVVLMNSRPEVEADLNKISTRTHNPGLDLAPQCRESAVHAGAGSLLGAPSAWPVRMDHVQNKTYRLLKRNRIICPVVAVG